MAMHLLVRRPGERVVIIDASGQEFIIAILSDNRIGIETPEGVLVQEQGVLIDENN